jgi:enamine deaminase RidA (YjgF/YER057c/UK114 family)
MTITRHEPWNGTLSDVVEAGGFVFLGGQLADDISQDIEGQTRQTLANIDAALARSGTNKSKLVSATVFIADMALFERFNAVWKAWVDPRALPARATVEAKLYDPRCLIEIIGVAVK